jgi:hypothetical protein
VICPYAVRHERPPKHKQDIAITRSAQASPHCYEGEGGYVAMLALANPNATDEGESTYYQDTYIMVCR